MCFTTLLHRIESDEMITLRLSDLYENIALWSRNAAPRASDVWEADRHMTSGRSQNVQEKMLGATQALDGSTELVVTRRRMISGADHARYAAS